MKRPDHIDLPAAFHLPPVFSERYRSIEIGDRSGVIIEGSKLNVPFEP